MKGLIFGILLYLFLLFTGKIADIQNQFSSAIKNVEPKVKNIVRNPAL